MFLLACVVLALAAAMRDAKRLGEAALITAAAVFLCAQWLYSASGQFALIGFGLLTAGMVAVLVRRRSESGGLLTIEADRLPPSWWSGLAVIALATALKLVALSEFPAHLNAYSAETGWWGFLTLDGNWPEGFLRGQRYDLVNGGRSPLHLPLTWLTVRLAGGTVYALRLAEVLASTVLLAILWSWLRVRVKGWWSVAALAVFALSPWHLAQSRMGTFYSASVAVGLALLASADRLDRHRRVVSSNGDARDDLATWAFFGFAAGLIGYAYAPLRVLYAFFALVWARLSWSALRRRRPGWWRGPSLAAIVFGGLLVVQLGVPPRFDAMFGRSFGMLATDTSIRFKTVADEVTETAQPLAVVVENARRNLVAWWRSTWTEERILVWYAPALAAALPAAAWMLWRSETWVPALYFLIGVIPPLLVYPVQRRTLVLWPLVYVAGVVAGRELASMCARLVDRAWWRSATWLLLAGFASLAMLHGLKVYATTNSIVAVGAYFGPDYTLDMLLEAERLLPRCRVYLVNTTYEDRVVAMVQLYEPGRRAGSEPVDFFDHPAPDDQPPLPRDRPLCLLLMTRDPYGDNVELEATMADLGELLPGSVLLRRWAGDGSDTLQYAVLMASAVGADDAAAAADGEGEDGEEGR